MQLAHLAFQAAQAALATSSLNGLVDVMREPLRRVGVVAAVGVEVASLDGQLRTRLRFGQPIPDLSAFGPLRGALRDPRYEHAQSSVAPFLWSELEDAGELHHGRVAALLERYKSAMSDVLSIPGHGPGPRLLVLHLTIDRGVQLDQSVRTIANLLGSLYVIRALSLLAGEPNTTAVGGRLAPKASCTLSARQLECLYWAREGKSAGEIGTILGLSARTVEEHLSNACARLGVRTRIQAVSVALAHEIL
jgi:LuxR family quorum sensing-dependent transcriptional regulator